MTEVLFLADFSVIKPDPGLIFWTSLIFILVWVILGRMAFGPIQNALQRREQDIQNALDEARKARQEMANLKAENEELLKQAQEERAAILKEAKEAKNSIIEEARNQAKEEYRRIVTDAKEAIENQRMAMIVDLKNQLGVISIDIAEKILHKELKGDKQQEQFVRTLVDEIKLN
ncbi:MAG: F0F1 ATP synthase subunit B [Lewinellaceae bacterium]|nr:F0F1 ATP synthase subunit B [Phaeodactylibacter sp.]MCB0613753.1 F0F1 ATP synthase subunit B [Phaeodactylibacter sp.]MCB9348713.1 F0F1 ATP synthase subunit B [Lewinellaceae bacterium]